MIVLITGGSGFIGSLLAKEILASGNEVVIFDARAPEKPITSEDKVAIYQKGDISNLPEVLNAVQIYKVDKVFHLAAMLGVPSEMNPWAAINVNALGTYHVLEAARLLGVKQVLITSSLAVYLNGGDPEIIVTEESLQRPQVMYGVTKVFSELLSLYYYRKFGLDIRGVRFPVLIGPHWQTPGFGQYNSKIIESAILGQPYEVNVPEDTTVPLLYIKDAVNSLIRLAEAPKEQVITRIYNLGQIMPPPTAGDIVRVVQSYLPEARISFNPDPVITEIVRTTPKRMSGERAREEWGWSLRYSLDDTVKDFFEVMREEMPAEVD